MNGAGDPQVVEEIRDARRRGGLSAVDAEALTGLGIDLDAVVSRMETQLGSGVLDDSQRRERRGGLGGTQDIPADVCAKPASAEINAGAGRGLPGASGAQRGPGDPARSGGAPGSLGRANPGEQDHIEQPLQQRGIAVGQLRGRWSPTR